MSSPKGRRPPATTVARLSIDHKQQQQKDELYRKRHYDLWLASIDAWIHQLLYVRKLYPSAAFRPSFSPMKSMTMTKYYHCQHPSTANYIRDVLTKVVLPTIFSMQHQQRDQQHQRRQQQQQRSGRMGSDVDDDSSSSSSCRNDDYDDEIVLELYEPAKSSSSSGLGPSSSSTSVLTSPEIVYEQYFLTLSRRKLHTIEKIQQQHFASSMPNNATPSGTTAEISNRMTTEYLDLLEKKLRDLIVGGIGKLDNVERHPSYIASNTVTFRILLRRRPITRRRCSKHPQEQCNENNTNTFNNTELQDALSSGEWCYHTSTVSGSQESCSEANETTTSTTTQQQQKHENQVSHRHHHQQQQQQQLQCQQEQQLIRKRILFSCPTMGFHFFYRCLPSHSDKDISKKNENGEGNDEKEREGQYPPRKKKVRIAL